MGFAVLTAPYFVRIKVDVVGKTHVFVSSSLNEEEVAEMKESESGFG